MPQVDVIYIFCYDKSCHDQWVQAWTKINGVHTKIEPICQALQLVVKQCNQDFMAVSFVKIDHENSMTNLNQLEASFMYTRLFKDILLDMNHDEKSIKYLTNYCKKLYKDNVIQLDIIREFESTYDLKSSIWWYTRECFTYQILNRALRTLEGDTIINMGFFIHDLHQQIQQLYREQGLSKIDFKKLVKTNNGLMSFNNFLSTSKSYEVSFGFAKAALKNTDMIGVLFKMTIDPSISSAPFASIKEVSYFKTEEEVLFSMHTIFRIETITKIDKNNPLYQVELKLTADHDPELHTLTEFIRKDVVGETGWERLGYLLLKISQFDKAEELYIALLEQTSDESKKAIYYNQLGYTKESQGNYKTAINYYHKALEIFSKTLPPNHPTLATLYNNIGYVYMKIEEYLSALSFYENSRTILEETLSSDDPSLAFCYSNIGLIYYNVQEHQLVLIFHEKALQIRQKILPQNHPDLAITYNNIGKVYEELKDYSKALSSHEKALEIRQKSLPPNHPDLAQSYNGIGFVYMKTREYSKALSFLEKDLEICRKSLPPNHPDLATTYHSIGLMYIYTGKYSKALSFLELARDIREPLLSANHSRVVDVQMAIEILKQKL